MALQTFADGETGLSIRTKINAQFTELYAAVASPTVTAAGVTFTPVGGLAADDVQEALAELDTEKAPLASPALTGTPTAPTAAANTNTTQVATTAYVQTELVDYALLASPALSGNPTAPTQSQADDSTKIATTAYVRAAISAILGGVASAFDTLAEIATELALKATLASPALTGTPTAPTAAADTSTTQIATTAYVQGELTDRARLDAADQALTGGVIVTSLSLGTVTTGTVTPDPGDRPMQHYTNDGAHTLAPSSNAGSILLDITNGSSAGAITTSGFTFVDGDSFTTTEADKFRCHISIGNAGSLLTVQAMQ